MITELDSLVERLIYERSPAERKKTDSKKAIPILQQYVNHENLEVSYLAKFWIAMIERKELPEPPAGLEWGD